MVPHKDNSSLPNKNQVKIMCDQLDDLSWKITSISNKLRKHDDNFKIIRIDLKELTKAFQKQDKKLEIWKSEIHNLIDKGFTSKAKKLDQEVGILNNRTVELRKKVSKLETSVFASN